jgi:NAD(P)-dependent dehydrogenase (short-subunit alcohol dehydrogenase family)
MLLEGKRAIVTGVGPGLGRSIAVALAREGAAVALAARTESVLKEVAAEIEAGGGRALAVPTDVSDKAQCARLVDAAVAELGGVDVLASSAFVPDVFQPFESVDLDEWRRMFDVNLFGALQVAQQVVAPMRAAGRGSIVFVGSMTIRKPYKRESGYATSKGALLVAGRALASELGPDGIRVNMVVPGWMWGPNVQAYFSYREQTKGTPVQDQIDEVTANIPLRTIPTPDEVAGAVVFFASDLASMVTGQSLDVNGGEVFR